MRSSDNRATRVELSRINGSCLSGTKPLILEAKTYCPRARRLRLYRQTCDCTTVRQCTDAAARLQHYKRQEEISLPCTVMMDIEECPLPECYQWFFGFHRLPVYMHLETLLLLQCLLRCRKWHVSGPLALRPICGSDTGHRRKGTTRGMDKVCLS